MFIYVTKNNAHSKTIILSSSPTSSIAVPVRTPVRSAQIKQQPTYLDKEKLDAAIAKLRVLPGLVQPVRFAAS